MRTSIDSYYGEYKRGILGKKQRISIVLYEEGVEVTAFRVDDGKVSQTSVPFDISMDLIEKIYMDKIEDEYAIFIQFRSNSVVSHVHVTIVLLGLNNPQDWFTKIDQAWNHYCEEVERRKEGIRRTKEILKKESEERELSAKSFYEECSKFHIKNSTPVFTIFSEKNKMAAIYIDEARNLVFLKIDGYEKEESVGQIEYKNIHYYDKAGNVSYVTDVKGSYSSYSGGVTGANFSKLLAVGGGLLFGLLGLAIGTALTYKPAEEKPSYSSFTIDSDVKKIDDRNVMLNFYSEIKKQYVDIELPQDIFNFLQTYMPEKKYTIVDELERRTVVHQAAEMIENGGLLRVSAGPMSEKIVEEQKKETVSMEEFRTKVEKLKVMREAGILSEAEFEEEKQKLLRQI